MNQNIRAFLIFSSIFLAIDLYVWQGIKLLSNGWTDANRIILRIVYWSYTALNFTFFLTWRFGLIPFSRQITGIVMAIIFAILIAKVFWMIFLSLDDVVGIFRWLVGLFAGGSDVQEKSGGISRLRFLNYMGLGFGAAFVGTALWGIAKGAHNYKIRRRNLSIKGLPDSFEDLKIVQISDIHSGSFWSYDAVKRGVELVKKEQADVVFFTGDIVNDLNEEMAPWISLFGEIKAPLGVYSILGNHDYGDYHIWEDKTEYKKPTGDKSHMSPLQRKNLENIHKSHADLGWNLLLDEHRIIEKNGDKIAIIGVENWSAKLNFPRYGNLDNAYRGTEDIPVKLLLSHDPSHWKAEVRERFKDIQATFSGHTHGMQFGIDTRYYRWSPVRMLYKEWIDLYTEGDQHLYVNRGFGYLGYPGRMGVFPEITVFRLKKA